MLDFRRVGMRGYVCPLARVVEMCVLGFCSGGGGGQRDLILVCWILHVHLILSSFHVCWLFFFLCLGLGLLFPFFSPSFLSFPLHIPAR